MKQDYLKSVLRQNKSSFSRTENEIFNYFDKIGYEVANKSLAELSNETGISESSIFNFVKKLGFSGFQDFRIKIATMSPAVAEERKLTGFTDIEKTDEPFTIAQKVISSNAQSISDLIYSIDEDTINNALELMNNSTALHFFGIGASSLVAFDSFHKFHRTHMRCNYVVDSHMQLTYATKLDENDCAFVFSHTGNTIETVEIAEVLRRNGVKVIAMTGNPNSKLVKLADVSFVVHSQEFSYQSEALTARFLYLTLIDILYVSIMYQDEEENIASLNQIRDAIDQRRLK